MSTSNAPGPGPAAIPPLAPWYERTQRAHVVQFYSDDEFLLGELSCFIGTALGAGDAALVICTKSHRLGLERRLRQRGFDVATAAGKGRYVPVDAAEMLDSFMVNGTPDADRFTELLSGAISRARAAAEGDHPRVVAFGEMVALLWDLGNKDGALRLEELWNQLAHTQSFSLRCAYPLPGFNRTEHGDALLRICEQHSAVIPGESYTSLETEEERFRSITALQQKAQALETEKAERWQVEQSLRRREADLAEVLENAIEGVQQVGPDRKILWANHALLKLLGYETQEYIGRDLKEFHVDPSVFGEFWQRLMRREELYNFPAEMRCKDGSVKSVLIHSNGLWENGHFVHTRCFVRDVTEKERMEEALRESESRLRLAKEELQSVVEERTAALRRLSAQVLSLQDLERRRLARELHDSLGQYLVGLKLNVDVLRQTPENEEMWEHSDELLERCISEVRTLSYLLHPPMMDEAGLLSAAQWYVDGFGQRSGLKVTLHSPEDLGRLPDAVEVSLFRVLQEALTNVHRHSRATEAEVHIGREPAHLVLQVKDNGRGIDPELLRRFHETGAGMGVGLTGMRERVRELGGSLALNSSKSGTILRVRVPAGQARGTEYSRLRKL
jgi:PAS domain S-box-containing protein